MIRGKFLTIDGSEGAGKTTQLTNIHHYLDAHGIDHLLTREPGGTATGERIRNIFLDKTLTPAAETELLLIFAARKQHLIEVIEPALARGQWVISDRFNDATYAYQGGGRGIPTERIRALETWVMGKMQPDLSLILIVSPEIAAQRIDQRGGASDRIENEQQAFFDRVRATYTERTNTQPHVKRIDADGSPDVVFAQIHTYLDQLRGQP